MRNCKYKMMPILFLIEFKTTVSILRVWYTTLERNC